MNFRLAALEIAKFQDQLIKRLNEDAMLQLTPLDASNSNAALGDGTSSSSTNGQSPATEAVLLYHHHQHPLMPHHLHYHHHHEWNFARAFLYSLTVLTTIGKCCKVITPRGAYNPQFALRLNSNSQYLPTNFNISRNKSCIFMLWSSFVFYCVSFLLF